MRRRAGDGLFGADAVTFGALDGVAGETSVPFADLEVVADRPFYLAIRDRETGLFLFLGRVTDPTARATRTPGEKSG